RRTGTSSRRSTAQPCQVRATEHPLSAPRCRGGIGPSAREVQGRQRGARNRNPPNVDRGKGTGQVAKRRVPKYQDLRGASRSPSRGSSCNLVGKPRLALNQQQDHLSRCRWRKETALWAL